MPTENRVSKHMPGNNGSGVGMCISDIDRLLELLVLITTICTTEVALF